PEPPARPVRPAPQQPASRPAPQRPAARPPVPAAASGRERDVREVPEENESDGDRAKRARVPSWDDILLGVRRNP
ncbi:MAG TPA: hypothetical protein VFX70_10095, partial [Mycobacteriales bacterium]|nr:hypothetical protein [Mycobacteriales bacterium]